MQTDIPISTEANLPQLRSLWWRVGQVAWVGLACFATGMFFMSLSPSFERYSTICTGPNCLGFSLYPGAVAELAAIGFTPNLYAATIISLDVAMFLIFFSQAAFIFYHASRQVIGWITACSLAILSAGIPQSTLTLQNLYPLAYAVFNTIGGLGFTFTFLFPDGRFIPRWIWFPALLGLATIQLYGALFVIGTYDAPSLILNFQLFIIIGCQIIAIYAQIYRYRHAATTQQRQQIRWGAIGIGIFILSLILWGALFEQYHGQGVQTKVGYNLILLPIVYLPALALPLVLTYTILRYQLWQINVIFNRALIYGSLTLTIVVLYVIIVSGLGLLLQVENNTALSLIATGLIAVVFHPIRLWLQERASRLLYGDRENPLGVLSRLAEILVSSESAVNILPAYAREIAESLKLPYTAISIRQAGNNDRRLAQFGDPQAKQAVIPLHYHNQPVGQLEVGYRPGERGFNQADQRLLEQIAIQTAMAVNTVRLSRDLQQSRERIVTSREEERRRLRRDLHDGLGPMLAGQGLKLAAAKQLMLKNPDTAQSLLSEVIQKNEETVSEVRRLVYGLRPPALDELGLGASLEAEAQAILRQSEVTITISPDPLPPLSAAVEVAVYRITLEALNNVARHAQAGRCSVQIEVERYLTLTILDDGCGVPPDYTPGEALKN